MTRPVKEDRKRARTDSFIARWSRLKQEATLPPESPESPIEATAGNANEAATEPLCDSDMPPLESLDEQSDYSGFLAEKVSETLRRQALRKLFHSAAFNVCDGLDDYDGNYTSFAGLGEIVTADMRHQLAMAEAKLKAVSGASPQPTPQPTEEPEQAAAVEPATVDAGMRSAGGDAEDSMPAANGPPDSGSDDGTTS